MPAQCQTCVQRGAFIEVSLACALLPVKMVWLLREQVLDNSDNYIFIMDINELRRVFCAPHIPNQKAYYFSLDGGGRNFLTDYINDNSINTMVEIGSFLCGSTVQWLEACPELTVIGIDPWEEPNPELIEYWVEPFYKMLEKYNDLPLFDNCFEKIDNRELFITSVKENGAYISAMANIQEYRQRFVPLMGLSPDKLYAIKNMGITPDLIYFDSDKRLEDLSVAFELFPDAVLAGDDWTWGADQGYPVQTAVNEFCNSHGFEVTANRATWILKK